MYSWRDFLPWSCFSSFISALVTLPKPMPLALWQPVRPMLIVIPETAISGAPAGYALDARGFWGFVHQDFFFRHDLSLVVIATIN